MTRAVSFRTFVIGLLAGGGVLLALVAGFNRIVDPFAYYGEPEIAGFNAVKTKFRRFERHVKPAIVARERPEAVTIGSSFAEIGFDPLNPAFTDGGRLKGYNLALAGTDWASYLCHFEFAAGATDLERAVVGIHATDLPDVDCSRQFPGIGKVDAGTLLLSGKALKASIDTVREQRRERPSHTPEGRYFYTLDEPGSDRRFREFFAMRFKGDGGCRKGLARGLGAERPPAVSAQRNLDLSGLRRMVRLAASKGIELRLVVYPRHAYSLELDFLCGIEARQWEGMRQIAATVEDESRARGGSAQVWEFLAFDEVTGEAVSGAAMRYWQDPEHFNAEVGDLMLRDMFGGGTPAFGRRLSSDGLDANRARFEAQRRAFLAANPWFYPELAKLLPAGRQVP